MVFTDLPVRRQLAAFKFAADVRGLIFAIEFFPCL